MKLGSVTGTRAGGNRYEIPMGGNVHVQGNVRVHEWLDNGNLSVPNSLLEPAISTKVLAVGGGGGGGVDSGGGGGAGGLTYKPSLQFPAAKYGVYVGNGGLGSSASSVGGQNGNPTYFDLTTLGKLANVGAGIQVIKTIGASYLVVPAGAANATFSILNSHMYADVFLLAGGSGGSKSAGGNGGKPLYKTGVKLKAGSYSISGGSGGAGQSYRVDGNFPNYSIVTLGPGDGVPAILKFNGNTIYSSSVSSEAPHAGGIRPGANGGDGVKITADNGLELAKLLNVGTLIDGELWVGAGGGGGPSYTGDNLPVPVAGGKGGKAGGGNGGATQSIAPTAAKPNTASGGGGGWPQYNTFAGLGYAGSNGGMVVKIYETGGFVYAGGGGGGASFAAVANVGSSGGGGAGSTTSTFLPGATGISGQGNQGGTGITNKGAGGGGSLGFTNSVNATTKAGDGGLPTPLDITGTQVYYAGGGGGGSIDSTAGSGNQSGGSGGSGGPAGSGQSGVTYTGGGGGGAGSGIGISGGAGGKGVAYIRYESKANQGIGSVPGKEFFKSYSAPQINGNWYTFTFLSDQIFTLTKDVTAEILLIGAGANGGLNSGGGAGGVVYIPTTTLPAGSYNIKIGKPRGYNGANGFGIPQVPAYVNPSELSGGNSFIQSTTTNFNLLALGGASTDGVRVGGSGSGGANNNIAGQKNLPGLSGQYGYGSNGGNYGGIGAGGGATEAGYPYYYTETYPGKGGDGISVAITGTPTYYAGGGASYVDTSKVAKPKQATGGLGGGGNFNSSATNYGGGAGGRNATTTATSGFQGLAIIKFCDSNIVRGGDMGTVGTYTLHRFTTPGTYTFATKIALTVDMLMVAGGGSGGLGGGGGGGGGLIYRSALTLPAGEYAVTVGAGGASGITGSNGTNTVFQGDTMSFTAMGGSTGLNNGGGSDTGSGGNSGSTSVGAGLLGGAGNTTTYGGGGGAGAAQAGYAADNLVSGAVTANSGRGGSGTVYDITGEQVYYAGGGGGGGNRDNAAVKAGAAGLGGGAGSQTGSGSDAPAKTGGGGGGGAYVTTSSSYPGGKGSDGVVYIRYLTSSIPLGNM